MEKERWMNKKAELEYYFHKYPEVSPLLIVKLSVTKYGVVFSQEALSRLQEADYRFTKAEPFGIQLEVRKKEFYTPGAVIFRDGSSVLVNYGEPYEQPYTVAYEKAADVFLLTEDGVVVETIDFLPRPSFFNKQTSKGTPMDHIGGTCTVQRLLINGFQKCRFWERGEQCHYCALFSADSAIAGEVDLADIRETVHEAKKESGRFTEISVSGGSDFGGNPPFSTEINRYIKVLQAVSDGIPGKQEVQLMAPAYKREDLQRIYENTCLTSYRPNIEVWDASSFRRLCPGKEHWIGRESWIARMCDAVAVFGVGRVYTQMVCGAELAAPRSLESVEAAIASAVTGCRFFAENGISCHEEVWRPHRRERLGWQQMQELDYFIQIAKLFHEIHQNYGICTVDTNYMRGSDNPDADLERIDLAEAIPVENQYQKAEMKRREYAPQPIIDSVQQMLKEKLVQVYVSVGDGTAFLLDLVYCVKAAKLMIPLVSDKSTLSSFLVKCLWFKQSVQLFVCCADDCYRLDTSVYRHHLVGPALQQAFEVTNGKQAPTDIAAVEELHLNKIEKCKVPTFRIRDIGEIFAHKHL